uniref:Retrotransposon Copia-like N-terminal domain-containing protein n=1 Tax=Cannabis sativa TaxID=3483 RepID=A0A803QH98_CANSA
MEILTGVDNYSSLRRSVVVALLARNKIKFINDKLPAPDEDDEDFVAWIRCNSFVISWILHSVSPTIADSIMHVEDASHIWSELEERFHQKNAPRVFEVKRSMQTLTQGSNDVTSYYT